MKNNIIHLNLVGTVETQEEIRELEVITTRIHVSMRFLKLGRLARMQVLNEKRRANKK